MREEESGEGVMEECRYRPGAGIPGGGLARHTEDVPQPTFEFGSAEEAAIRENQQLQAARGGPNGQNFATAPG
ncbi:MAG TPA: hypothetical protein VL332_08015 [Candidatus Saccharimonadaceae bacterium]|nr:hypothetical protein [Candidatus Saccharimonadaceae bacterium]